MKTLIDQIKPNFLCRTPAPEHLVVETEERLGYQLPDDYRSFLMACNGGEGFVGEHYLAMWGVEDLLPFNQEYEISTFVPELLAFASTGAGEGYAFQMGDSVPAKVVQIPFIGLSMVDAVPVAGSFEQLLQRMLESSEPLI